MFYLVGLVCNGGRKFTRMNPPPVIAGCFRFLFWESALIFLRRFGVLVFSPSPELNLPVLANAKTDKPEHQ
jgi:hypothetical protein